MLPIYANWGIKNIAKPAAFLIIDGQVTDVFTEKKRNKWLLRNQDDWARRHK